MGLRGVFLCFAPGMRPLRPRRHGRLFACRGLGPVLVQVSEYQNFRRYQRFTGETYRPAQCFFTQNPDPSYRPEGAERSKCADLRVNGKGGLYEEAVLPFLGVLDSHNFPQRLTAHRTSRSRECVQSESVRRTRELPPSFRIPHRTEKHPLGCRVWALHQLDAHCWAEHLPY